MSLNCLDSSRETVWNTIYVCMYVLFYMFVANQVWSY
jgi:hypothetical protein